MSGAGLSCLLSVACRVASLFPPNPLLLLSIFLFAPTRSSSKFTREQKNIRLLISSIILVSFPSICQDDLAEAAGYEFANDDDPDAEPLEDPVPSLTKEHFEEAMAYARRSVPAAEIARYDAFAKKMKQAAGGAQSFSFEDERAEQASDPDSSAGDMN